MTDNRTYKTKVYLTCSNSQTNYTFAFDYINVKYIKATINGGNPLTWGTDYVVNGHTLTLTKSPAQGDLLLIYRETPTDKTVEWYDSSILRAKDMNLFNTQLLHVNEENVDRLADSGIQEDKLDNRWDAREKPIKNLKAPTEDTEAVNLGFLKSTQESYLNASQAKVNEATTQAQLATNQANNAKEYARQAKASADAASMSQVQASTKASEAQANASSASNSASNASTSADNASASETNANTSERKAKEHEDKTREYMETTLSYKLDADQSAAHANNSMIQSATYAEEAKKYRDEAKAIAGKDFVTNEAFESYKQSVPNSIQAKVDSHNESLYAHYQLFQSVNQELDTKATKNELNTMKDNVNNQLANKADMADLSSKRDISNATFSNNIVVDNGEWSGLELKTSNGKYMQIEVSPDKDNRIGTLMRKNSDGETEAILNIPMRTGTLATTDQIPEGGLGNAPFRQNNTSNAHLIKNNYWGLWTSTGTLNFDWFSANKNPYVAFDTQGIKIQGILVRHVVSESTSGSGFWREWNDGWLEQGGFVASSGRDTQLNYNRPFRSEPTINVIARAHDGTYLSGSQSNMQVSYIGNTGCRISMYNTKNLQGYCWQAWGWKA
nr:MAG TPA: tail fiber protein [Caudoviricetes sp.]